MTEETQTTGDELKHFNLVSGTIVFIVGDEQESRINEQSAIVASDTEDFLVADLMKAQRNLQAIFFQKVGQDERIRVIDVIIENRSYLAHTTATEFYKMPQEVADAIAKQEASKPEVIRTVEDLKEVLGSGGVKVQ